MKNLSVELGLAQGGDRVEPAGGKGWTFLTNHARVLIAIARDPKVRIRDISDQIGITERAAQLIVNDLVEAGYLTRKRVGRRNTYTVDSGRPFRYPTEADQGIHALLGLFTDDRDLLPRPPSSPPPGPHDTRYPSRER